jgi:hypothetical protein
MKKIFTLVAATLFTAVVFAADRKPVVTVTASKNYEIVIDGKSYFSSSNTMSISSLYNGQHNIKVYQVSKGFFSKRKKLVSTSSFQLRGNDMDICLDFRGQISITEQKPVFEKRWDDKDKGWGNGNGRDKGHDNDRNDRDRHF